MQLAADEAADALVTTGTVFAGATRGGWAGVRDGVGVMVTGVPAPTLNGVLCARPGAVGTASALLDEVAATGLPYCLETREGDVAGEMLARSRGMTDVEHVPFMLLDLADWEPPEQRGRTLAPDEVDVHIDTMVAGFEMPPDLLSVFRGSRLLERDDVRCYVVEEDGEAVATALGIVANDHVGVFDVATVPSRRGRGLGAAITARVIADGAAAGARAAFLQSSAMGYSVYERLGFRTADHWTVWVAT